MSAKPAHQEAEPADLLAALASALGAEAAWRALTPIARRDFRRWIETARQTETRLRRIRRTCESVVAGKRRPCCYAVVPLDLYRLLGEVPAAKSQWSSLTPDERRNLVDWVEEAEGKELRRARVEEACALLAAGTRGAP